MKRIAIYGSPCSGKSSLANQLGEKLNIPILHLDDIYHRKNWQSLPADDFKDEVRKFISKNCWIVDGNYRMVRTLVLSRATSAIILDVAPYVLLKRVIIRTIGRGSRFRLGKITPSPYHIRRTGTKEPMFDAFREFIPKSITFRKGRLQKIKENIQNYLKSDQIIIFRRTNRITYFLKHIEILLESHQSISK